MLQFRLDLNDGSYIIIQRGTEDDVQFVLHDSEGQETASGTITPRELSLMGQLLGSHDLAV